MEYYHSYIPPGRRPGANGVTSAGRPGVPSISLSRNEESKRAEGMCPVRTMYGGRPHALGFPRVDVDGSPGSAMHGIWGGDQRPFPDIVMVARFVSDEQSRQRNGARHCPVVCSIPKRTNVGSGAHGFDSPSHRSRYIIMDPPSFLFFLFAPAPRHASRGG